MDDLKITMEGVLAEICRRDFYEFIVQFWESADTSEFIDNWHIGYIARQLQKVGELVINHKQKENDMIINLPPGTSKSMIVSVLFPAWLWANDPSIRIISASYSSATALELAIKTRNLLLSDKWKLVFPEIEIKSDESAKGHYKLKGGGGRLSTSTGSNVIGMHADIIIADDLENLDSVYSDAERTRVRRWVTGTLSTRKTDKLKTPTIYVQQRLHQQDLTSYLLSLSEDYKHIVLPSKVHNTMKPIVMRFHYEDGVLDTKRLNVEHQNEARKMLGSANYNAQFLQDPQDESDAIIKENWFTIMTQEEVNLLSDRILKSPKHYFLDTAYGGKNADYNAILECVKYHNSIYVTNVWRNKNEFPDFIETLKGILQGQRVNRVYIEEKASGKSIVQTLKRETSYNIKGVQSSDGKIVRLNGVAPVVESGRVILLNFQLLREFLDEVTTNNPANDDMRDTMVFAIEELLVKNLNYRKYDVR